MSATPSFAATPNRGSAVLTTANTNRDGTGTLGTVLTAGASGARIDWIRIQARVTTTAGMVRLYLSDGTSHNLIKEQSISAVTVTGSVTADAYDYVPTQPLILKAGETLRASTNNAEAIVVTAFGGDF